MTPRDVVALAVGVLLFIWALGMITYFWLRGEPVRPEVWPLLMSAFAALGIPFGVDALSKRLGNGGSPDSSTGGTGASTRDTGIHGSGSRSNGTSDTSATTGGGGTGPR